MLWHQHLKLMSTNLFWLTLVIFNPCFNNSRSFHETSPPARSRDRQTCRKRNQTASGIVIPDSAAEKPDQGEVLAVGPGKKNDKGDISPMAVKVGDRVLFGKYSGQTVKVDGDELLVMKEDDLFAVVEK